MRRKFSSFVAKKPWPQSRRDLSSSGYAPGSLYTPIALISALTGMVGYVWNDVANRVKAHKIMGKLEEERGYLHKVLMEDHAELGKEKFARK